MKINFSRAEGKFNFSEAALANVEHFGRSNTISESAKEAASKELIAEIKELQFTLGKSFEEAYSYVINRRPRCAHLTTLTPVRDDLSADVELRP
jgi:hypothetical protein